MDVDDDEDSDYSEDSWDSGSDSSDDEGELAAAYFDCFEDDASEVDKLKTEATKDLNELVPRVKTDTPKKTYDARDLPWDMKVAMPHPTIKGVIIFAGADMPHVVKKGRNSARNTGFEKHPRQLMLDGVIMSIQMLYDLWKLSSDSEGRGKEEGDLMLHRKLRKEIFELDASSLLRTPHAMKIFSQ